MNLKNLKCGVTHLYSRSFMNQLRHQIKVLTKFFHRSYPFAEMLDNGFNRHNQNLIAVPRGKPKWMVVVDKKVNEKYSDGRFPIQIF